MLTDAGPGSPIQVVFGSATDVGRRRPINEDAMRAGGSLFLVADGIGGHPGGEIASATVIAAFASLAERDRVTLEELQQAFALAVAAVAALPQGAGAGSGTTLTGVALAEVAGDAHWLVLNVGDSRTYIMRSGVLQQISVDHSVVQELMDSGQISAKQARTDPRRNIVTRSIGVGGRAEADYWFVEAEPGDRMLVCSDGLTNELSAGHVRLVLSAGLSAQATSDRLVSQALLHGGRDNVTVVVIDVLSPGSARTPAPGRVLDLGDAVQVSVVGQDAT